MQRKKIVILGTGGTIAGLLRSADESLGYVTAQLGVDQLIASNRSLADCPCELVGEQLVQLDSKDMCFSVWTQLALRVSELLEQPNIQGVVITHGTDTLEETAYFLDCVLNTAAPAKPVVLTCAMRPANAASADGPRNLTDAVWVACDPSAHGVLVVCASTIHSARNVQKAYTHQLNAFVSGPEGSVGLVEHTGGIPYVRLLRIWPKTTTEEAQHAQIYRELLRANAKWPRVEIVMSYAGASGALVEALLAQGVDGLVVAATGSGTVHQDLEAALLKAQAQGVSVVRASRCIHGLAIVRPEDAIADSQGLPPVKARVAMLLELMRRRAALARCMGGKVAIFS